ncbi:MAG: Gfo/Idh/MocA family oxidoreductase [Fimbriimonadaceae bacterium]|nr:Gfo/Idh/MocA family oxidoreductase [Fimbriimonadaceae bacterium]
MAEKQPQDEFSRRAFLGKAGAVAAAGAVAPLVSAVESPLFSRLTQSPNDKLVLGLIGCGGMGASNMRNLMNFADVEVAALCDVDDSRVPNDYKDVEKKYNRAPKVYKDYRSILDRKDIDAVIVGTPDHWHALNFIHACEAGKDAYQEKPLSHHLMETVAMAGAQEKHKRVVQCGTWQRSTKEFTDAINYVRSGKLGKVVQCRAWITDTTRVGKQKVSDPPKGLDYDMWVGPATFVPYQSNRCHWNWRWFMNFGGGLTTDWGVHMMDIALLGMSKDQELVMPHMVSTYGGQWAILDDDRTAPDVTESIFLFKEPHEWTLHWSVGRDHPGKPGHGTEFIGADGRTVRVWRGGWLILDPEGKEMPKEESPALGDHWRNFVDCVKTREKPRADLRSVAQTTVLCHLSNIALQSGQQIEWDNKKWDLAGNAGKNVEAYNRPYRKPYKLTVTKPSAGR